MRVGRVTETVIKLQIFVEPSVYLQGAGMRGALLCFVVEKIFDLFDNSD